MVKIENKERSRHEKECSATRDDESGDESGELWVIFDDDP